MTRLLPAAIAAAGIAVLLAACTDPATQQRVEAALTVGCQVDATWQPLGAMVASQVPQAALGAAIDQALIHPAVVAACAARGGKPAAVAIVPAAGAPPAVAPSGAVVAPAVKP